MKKSELTRINMIRQFVRSLNENGYHATSIKTIAEECGTYIAHVSYYFPKKEDLIKAVYTESIRISNQVLQPLNDYTDPLSYVFLRHLFWFYLAYENEDIRKTTCEIAKVHHNFENRINPYYDRACKMFLEKFLPFDPRSVYIASVSSIYSVCAVLERSGKLFETFDYKRLFRVLTDSFFAHVHFEGREEYVNNIIELFEQQDKKSLYEMNMKLWIFS